MSTNLTTGPSISPSPADRLRQEMRTIRRELGDDVEELVEQAERLMDSRCYVQRYPWGCLGAAAFVGFFPVPGRTVVSPLDEQTLSNLVERFSPAEKKESSKKSSLFNWALTAALGLASRAALAYATQQVSKFVAAQMPPPDPVEVHHG